jgi:hypothetical protein
MSRDILYSVIARSDLQANLLSLQGVILNFTSLHDFYEVFLRIFKSMQRSPLSEVQEALYKIPAYLEQSLS